MNSEEGSMTDDDIFQRLYDSEINFRISCFWDGGFDVKLGDEMNGYLAEHQVKTWAEVGPWLRDQAMKHRPDRYKAHNT
jgi:hypothetical protein